MTLLSLLSIHINLLFTWSSRLQLSLNHVFKGEIKLRWNLSTRDILVPARTARRNYSILDAGATAGRLSVRHLQVSRSELPLHRPERETAAGNEMAFLPGLHEDTCDSRVIVHEVSRDTDDSRTHVANTNNVMVQNMIACTWHSKDTCGRGDNVHEASKDTKCPKPLGQQERDVTYGHQQW